MAPRKPTESMALTTMSKIPDLATTDNKLESNLTTFSLESNPNNSTATKEATTDVARQAVFQTHELVENILLHLPARKVLSLQRVSKAFRNATTLSPQIKRKLFLPPSPSPRKKVLAYGIITPAVTLSPFYKPGLRHSAVGNLADRHFANDRHGVSMLDEPAPARIINSSSSLLDTYLTNTPSGVGHVKIRLDVCVQRAPELGVLEFTFERKIRVQEALTIKGMVRMALEGEAPEVVEGLVEASTAGKSRVWYGCAPKFWLYDVVVPSFADWAEEKAKEGRRLEGL